MEKHDPGFRHPESPSRLAAIREKISDSGILRQAQTLSDREAGIEEIARVHPPEYIHEVERLAERAPAALDGDTVISEGSWRAALLAAGAGLEAADEILSGHLQKAFLAVRPPGHHAHSRRGMGFCLFNNIAICTRHLLANGVKKIAILDWDVHHGNGTEEIFYQDGRVLFISLHQYPFYPGTGAATARGAGEGEGTNLNIPLAAGSGMFEYRNAFENQIAPAMENFAPEFLLISAGFDAHKQDPLASMNLTASSFEEFTAMSRQWAADYTGGRIISFLEGGYDLDALADSALAHAGVLSTP